MKQYSERDIMMLDKAGSHYIRHVEAMTSEELHSKSDIAAELGHRDHQIAELRAERESMRDVLAKMAKSLYEKCGWDDVTEEDAALMRRARELLGKGMVGDE